MAAEARIRDKNAAPEDVESGEHERKGTVWTATAHIVTAVIGSGVLALAWSVAAGLGGRAARPRRLRLGHRIDLDRVDMSGGGDGGGRCRRRPRHVCLPPPSSCSNDWSPSVRRRWSSGRAPPPPLPHLCRSQSQAAASRPRLRRSPPSPPAAPALAVRRRR
uniref:Amino acid transporter transmembrane domain-containing protein n=1 Tax=Oryza barthii TaxID=65489 RepID=A0A0D3G6V7_9ORYZ